MAVHRVETHRSRSPEQSKTSDADLKGSHWPGYIQFLFVVGLTALFIALAVSMQRHHFLDGSLDHREQRAADQ
jgi:hypothetical protein